MWQTVAKIVIVAAIGIGFFGLVAFDWWRHRGRKTTASGAAADGLDAGVVWLATTSHHANHDTGPGTDSSNSSSGSDGF